MGALTSKKGEFSFRNWEQRAFKEYDDTSLLTTLKLRVEKIKTQRTRVLPIHHWMADRKRFSNLNQSMEYGILFYKIKKKFIGFQINRKVAIKAHMLKIYNAMLSKVLGINPVGFIEEIGIDAMNSIGLYPVYSDRLSIDRENLRKTYMQNHFFIDKAFANKNFMYFLNSPLNHRNELYFDFLTAKRVHTTKSNKTPNYYYTHFFEKKLENKDNLILLGDIKYDAPPFYAFMHQNQSTFDFYSFSASNSSLFKMNEFPLSENKITKISQGGLNLKNSLFILLNLLHIILI